MPTYIETCPLRVTDKAITFSIEGARRPSPTRGCICGGTTQEQNLQIEYRSFTVKGRHNSTIVKVKD